MNKKETGLGIKIDFEFKRTWKEKVKNFFLRIKKFFGWKPKYNGGFYIYPIDTPMEDIPIVDCYSTYSLRYKAEKRIDEK